MAQLSVIIPTLNEAQNLPGLWQMLAEQNGIEIETIVADGGSSDDTPRLARERGALVIEAPPGRGTQMNRGAAVAGSPWLLFLHADSTLTSPTQLAEAVDSLARWCERRGNGRVAGHFRLRFTRSRPGHDLAYHYYEEKSALNRPECTNGDQGFLLSKGFFEELGGFDESLWFLEDQRLAETIRQRGVWITLPGVLATSARRFETEGLGRRLLLSAIIMNFHHQGLIEFFHRSAGVYRRQEETGRLAMSPILEVIEQLDRETDLKTRLRRYLADGRYAHRHLWQPCFFADLLLRRLTGGSRAPLLAFHDRILHPLTDFPPFHAIAGGIVRVAYLGCRFYFKLRDG